MEQKPKTDHREEVKKFITIKALGVLAILMLSLFQVVLFYISEPFGSVWDATVIIIDIILISAVLAITYKKYHEYHITDIDFYQVP